MSAVSPNSAPITSTSGLARALTQANVLTAAQIDPIHKKSQIERTTFVDSLLQSGLITAKDLAAFCSEAFGYPLVDLAVFDESMLPEKIVDVKLMQSQRIVALAKRGNKISLATSDPTNTNALDQIKFQTGLGVELVIVQHDILLKLLEK